MSFGTKTIWEINSGGSDTTNGGGFDPGATFATDLAATVATSAAPVVTSASYNFITRDGSQYLFVASGTNWTPGMYPITSTSGNAATLNAAIGAVVLYNSLGQPTGLNTVAGCATTASPTGGTWGIDYSRGTTPVIAFTDMVIDATTNTKFTSSGNPVGPHLVGNVIAMTSGTGFTFPQRVEVLSVSGTTATCDKALGTTSSTGGHGGLGGSLALLPGALAGVQGNGNVIAINNAGSTYSLATQANILTSCILFGYTTTRFPQNTDTKASLKPTANSFTMFVLSNGAAIQNIAFTNPGSQTGNTAVNSGNGNGYIINCSCDSFATGFNTTFQTCMIVNCYISNILASGVGITGSTGQATIAGCEVRGGGTGAVGILINNGDHLYDFIVSGIAGYGVELTGGGSCAIHGIVYGCTNTLGNGVNIGTATNALIADVHSEGNSQAGFLYTGTALNVRMINCSAYNNAGGNLSAILSASSVAVQGFIALTATAFTNTSGHDFSLNNTAGGGALLRGAGWPSLYPGGATTSYSDIGAAQTNSSAAGATAWAY